MPESKISKTLWLLFILYLLFTHFKQEKKEVIASYEKPCASNFAMRIISLAMRIISLAIASKRDQ